jgi:deoxyadenosine/deoxycytidine kinase
MKKFVAVAGNIGVGKSPVEMLCVEWTGSFYEPVTENPYLPTSTRYGCVVIPLTGVSHTACVHFLLSASTSVAGPKRLWMPRSLRRTYLQGTSTAGYQTYRDLYETTMRFLPPPDLVIYLRASVPTLMNRISNRGRAYEQTISPDYLNGLNNLYETWIDNFTLCPILAVPGDDLDFVSHPGHLRLILDKLEDKLTGGRSAL